MGTLWLKFKVWTKIIFFVLAVTFLVIFIFQNANKHVYIWYWFGKEEVDTTALRLMLGMFLAGVAATLLVRMALRTLRQIRELMQRSQAAQMHKDVADIRAKAAMLQTKPDGSPSAPPSPPPGL